MNDESRLPLGERMNGHVNVILILCSALALPSVVFLHRDLGSRFVGPRVLLTIVLILLAPSFWPNGDPHVVTWFLGAFLWMCFVARCRAANREARGEWIHRYYDGYPRLLRFFPRSGEAGFKRMEIFIVFAGAFSLMPVSEALGGFLIFSAIGLAISGIAADSAIKDRISAMRDQQIENQNLVERFREHHRN
jgi:hypothetical protein